MKLPVTPTKEDGTQRRVGVEIELGGLGPAPIGACLQAVFGGRVRSKNRFALTVENTELGDFLVELDAQQLRELGDKIEHDDAAASKVESVSADWLTKAIEQFVPWEVVTGPLTLTQLARLPAAVAALRAAGALGTRHAFRFAFGVHFNPELPDLKAETILAYMRAFFCLYDWIAERENIDLVRRLTPYINHFDRDYICKILAADYQPDLATLCDDYLDANPTRNRSLDMLPLFAHLDPQRVQSRLDDPLIKARPTLHYRLPNCDIDNPRWNLDKPWDDWLAVEALAADADKLRDICSCYRDHLVSLTGIFEEGWASQSRRWL